MNFFDALLHPDREEDPERAEVARAANLLQIGEFQFLQLAHAEWFGREMTEAEINRLFAAYMLHDRVPPWARHYARYVHALDDAGSLDDNHPSWHRYDAEPPARTPSGLRPFCHAVLAIALCLGGSLWLSHEVSDATSQILPPYFSDKEMGQAARNPDPVP